MQLLFKPQLHLVFTFTIELTSSLSEMGMQRHWRTKKWKSGEKKDLDFFTFPVEKMCVIINFSQAELIAD